MTIQLKIGAIVLAVLFLLQVIYLVRKNRADVGQVRKWIILSLLMLFGAIFADLGQKISLAIGFQVYSNFALFALIIIILFFLFRLQLAIIKAEKDNTLLIQEVSILKEEVKRLKEAAEKEK